MGRWFVIFLAMAATMGILLAFFPTLRSATFNVAEHPVHWAFLVGLGITYTYYKLTSK